MRKSFRPICRIPTLFLAKQIETESFVTRRNDRKKNVDALERHRNDDILFSELFAECRTKIRIKFTSSFAPSQNEVLYTQRERERQIGGLTAATEPQRFISYEFPCGISGTVGLRLIKSKWILIRVFLSDESTSIWYNGMSIRSNQHHHIRSTAACAYKRSQVAKRLI